MRLAKLRAVKKGCRAKTGWPKLLQLAAEYDIITPAKKRWALSKFPLPRSPTPVSCLYQEVRLRLF